MDLSALSTADLSTLIITVGAVVLVVGIIGVAVMISLFSKTAFMFERMGKGAFSAAGAKKPSAPVVQKSVAAGGVSGEVVAAISAAVAEMMGTGNFRIQSIRKKTESRSSWGMAGVLESTRPF